VLRIIQSETIKLATVALDGKLLGPWVDEVRTIVSSMGRNLGSNLGRCDAVRLNLEGLSFADASGIALLQELHRGGVELFGCSALIAGLLAAHQRPAAGNDTPSRTPPGRAGV
jgi:ABC-type transporter Mla MlaB component